MIDVSQKPMFPKEIIGKGAGVMMIKFFWVLQTQQNFCYCYNKNQS